VKKTALTAYKHIHSGGILAINLRDDDGLVKVLGVNDDQQVVVCSHQGKAIRFAVKDIRAAGRTATGVRAIRLSPEDYIIGMDIVQEGATLLTVTEKGYGKRSDFKAYRTQTRGGRGIINIKTTEKVGPAAGILKVEDQDGIVLITSSGKLIRLSVKDISVIGRNTQGVRLIDIPKGETVAAITKLLDK
jgi:DNA gyrase subunit A